MKDGGRSGGEVGGGEVGGGEVGGESKGDGGGDGGGSRRGHSCNVRARLMSARQKIENPKTHKHTELEIFTYRGRLTTLGSLLC